MNLLFSRTCGNLVALGLIYTEIETVQPLVPPFDIAICPNGSDTVVAPIVPNRD